ncbi:hypothetical protein SVIO_073660 [Streptomyces violaceusniger]|uniref:butyrate kinase n=1 Tax=Streptomyces violaceusniger TaxID=68280 RepID=A0A4D4LF57_STRVO|nr:hypothetical protein SVIO_073660 [Streptomyces violaceusniger]
MNGSRVLVLNSGSSSVKYQLLDMADGSRPASGIVERIGEGPVTDHAAALKQVSDELAAKGLGLDSPELAAVGHRVVHGGTRFTEPTLITDEVVEEIEKLIPLAPLHNPANVTGIKVARDLRPDLPQVAVFDTAFHSTIPEAAARYAIDVETADRWGCGATASTAPRTRMSPGPPRSCWARSPRRSTRSCCTWATGPAPRRCEAAGAWRPRWG